MRASLLVTHDPVISCIKYKQIEFVDKILNGTKMLEDTINALLKEDTKCFLTDCTHHYNSYSFFKPGWKIRAWGEHCHSFNPITFTNFGDVDEVHELSIHLNETIRRIASTYGLKLSKDDKAIVNKAVSTVLAKEKAEGEIQDIVNDLKNNERVSSRLIRGLLRYSGQGVLAVPLSGACNVSFHCDFTIFRLDPNNFGEFAIWQIVVWLLSKYIYLNKLDEKFVLAVALDRGGIIYEAKGK